MARRREKDGAPIGSARLLRSTSARVTARAGDPSGSVDLTSVFTESARLGTWFSDAQPRVTPGHSRGGRSGRFSLTIPLRLRTAPLFLTNLAHITLKSKP